MKTQHNHQSTGPATQPSEATPSPADAPAQVIPRTELQPDLKSSLGALTGENLRQAERERLKISRARKKPAGAPSGISRARPSGGAIVGPKSRYGLDDLASR